MSAPTEHTLPSRAAATGPGIAACAALLAACGALQAGCAGPAEEEGGWTDETRREAARLEELLREQAEPAPPGAVRVRLAFGAGADLDLYVTDPLQETVYFANEESRSGGRLDADRRCDAAAPRVETVSFAAPASGRYRIGVDYPEACGEEAKPAPFAVSIEAGGRERFERGLIPPRRFQPIVEEFDVETD